jgi:hypothetical protein
VIRLAKNKENEKSFEMQLELALPSPVKSILKDAKGRNFFESKICDASFKIVKRTDMDFDFLIVKADPIRTYFFAFKKDSATFKMELNSNLVNNPYQFYLEILSGELRMITSIALEYMSEIAKVTDTEVTRPECYIG